MCATNKMEHQVMVFFFKETEWQILKMFGIIVNNIPLSRGQLWFLPFGRFFCQLWFFFPFGRTFSFGLATDYIQAFAIISLSLRNL